jgi:hypothetical protein
MTLTFRDVQRHSASLSPHDAALIDVEARELDFCNKGNGDCICWHLLRISKTLYTRNFTIIAGDVVTNNVSAGIEQLLGMFNVSLFNNNNNVNRPNNGTIINVVTIAQTQARWKACVFVEGLPCR